MKAPKPDYPMFRHPGAAFLRPADWLTRIAEYELAFKERLPDYPPGDIRGRLYKVPHEAWMAAMLGFCHAGRRRQMFPGGDDDLKPPLLGGRDLIRRRRHG
jgi:hypothetical protein